MKLFESLGGIPSDFGPSAVTIGKFDGMHAGHQRVIAELRAVAADGGLQSVAVTFDRHPLSLLRPEVCPLPLLSNAQKTEMLAAAGVDATLMLQFDEAQSAQSAEDFVREVLVGALRAKVVLIGSDFRFGARGAGDVALLQRLGRSLGYRVQLLDDVEVDGRRASSTWLRELLGQGRIAEATALLGRAPTIRSVVVTGEQRGRTFGYPTANLSPRIEGFVPADGVYAARITIAGKTYGAAVSVGNNPTFEGVPDKQVEAHVLDQDFDMYGATVELSFIDFIRPMVKFDGVDALIQQMTADEARIRTVLNQ